MSRAMINLHHFGFKPHGESPGGAGRSLLPPGLEDSPRGLGYRFAPCPVPRPERMKQRIQPRPSAGRQERQRSERQDLDERLVDEQIVPLQPRTFWPARE